MSQAPGWYDDLFGRDEERYWDGKVWTKHTRAVGSDDPGPFAAAVPDDPFAELSLEAGVAPLKTGRSGAVFAVVAAVLVVALVAGGAVFVLGHHSEAAATEAVTTAASQSLDAKSADMSLSMTFSGLGLNEQITGQGAFDFPDQTGTLTMNLPIGGQDQSEQIIEDGGTVYVSLGDLLGQVAPGKSWVSASPGQLSSGGGSSGALGGGVMQWSDPSQMLQQLQASGATVTSDGPTTFDGTAVTEYSVTVPSSAFSKYMGSLPSSLQGIASGLSLPAMTEKVYIESGNLLRAIDLPYSFGIMGKSFSMDMQMELSNYGTPVTVTPPPASEVLPYNQFGAIAGNSGNTGNSGNSGNRGSSGSGAI
ncbi:MAG TPA: DUF2510 domain-containing protein [Acidimicrobiales bacterium]